MVVDFEAMANVMNDDSTPESVKYDLIDRLTPMEALKVGVLWTKLVLEDKGEIPEDLVKEFG